ncbi:serine protease [Lithospermum erythrorhizon]|uniref:Serine protease n=1 Tax=Lithospermum erythrorhizon TaxID=34254 RepID=A0AAV3R447_LITER
MAKKAIFYSYKTDINSFAALLDEAEAEAVKKHPDVLAIFPGTGRDLQTTHSWNFLMMEKDGVVPGGSIWDTAKFGEDVIIGNLDTGVWPSSESFDDTWFGAIPSRWKGICQQGYGPKFPCNRKLIGARYFYKGFAFRSGKFNETKRHSFDDDGHGSHTLSTAGGNFVPKASVFGSGNGTARGGSPKARVASYKVCWPPEKNGVCYDSDMLEAFDTAIHDRVDVLSVSIGGQPKDYFNHGLSIGAFHAAKRGIVVVCAAGNNGPTPRTVVNVAPWIITVGASTMDREFQSHVKLQNGQNLKGASLSPALPEEKMYPLLSAALGKAVNASENDAILCKPGTLDPEKVKGNILVCLRGNNSRVEKGEVASSAGAAGMVLCNDVSTGNEIMSVVMLFLQPNSITPMVFLLF